MLLAPYHWVNFNFNGPLIDFGIKLQLVLRVNPITPGTFICLGYKLSLASNHIITDNLLDKPS